MNPQNHRPSAQILQFPSAGARAQIGAQRQAKRKLNSPELPITTTAMGGGWYHDAAISESARDRKP